MSYVWNITNNRGSSYNAASKEELIEVYKAEEGLTNRELIQQFIDREYHINLINSETYEIVEKSSLRFDGIE